MNDLPVGMHDRRNLWYYHLLKAWCQSQGPVAILLKTLGKKLQSNDAVAAYFTQAPLYNHLFDGSEVCPIYPHSWTKHCSIYLRVWVIENHQNLPQKSPWLNLSRWLHQHLEITANYAQSSSVVHSFLTGIVLMSSIDSCAFHVANSKISGDDQLLCKLPLPEDIVLLASWKGLEPRVNSDLWYEDCGASHTFASSLRM